MYITMPRSFATDIVLYLIQIIPLNIFCSMHLNNYKRKVKNLKNQSFFLLFFYIEYLINFVSLLLLFECGIGDFLSKYSIFGVIW